MRLGVKSAFQALLLLTALAVICPTQAAAQAGPPDYTLYAELLSKYVQNNRVDYTGFKQEEAKLDQFLELMAEAKPEDMGAQDQFAYYINAYNAWTIKLVLRKYPNLDTIRDVGSLFTKPWQIKVVRIGKEVFTLDHIEHEILRPRYKDPRVHFAINCAAISCPPLRGEPYLGDTLDSQLDDATLSFVNDPQRNYIKGNKLYLSKIFTWFRKDFPGGPVKFVLKYSLGKFKRNLEKNRDRINLKFLGYDWALNDI